jgi:pseudouridine-5'-phosphate glycosidase
VQFAAVNVTLSPAQISVFKQVIAGGAGGVFTLIDNSFDLSDLQVADSQVAVYLISAVGVIVLGEPVTPSDHITVPLHPFEVNTID